MFPAARSATLYVKTLLDAAEGVSGADLVGIDAAHTPGELAREAELDFLAFQNC
jgi:hypothetical protein